MPSSNKWSPLFVTALTLAALPQKASAGENKVLMAAVGDSISAATLADTDLVVPANSQGTPLWNLFESNNFSLEGVMTADALYTNRYTYSFSTGKDIDSHLVRLQSWLKSHETGSPALYGYNVAIPGGTSATMNGQMQTVVKEFKSGGYTSLPYVTVTIGADDACADNLPAVIPNDEFKNNLRTAFQTLAQIQQPEPIHVFISSIPKVPDTAQPQIRDSLTWGLLSCAFVRQHIATYCSRLTTWSTPAEYNTLVGYVEDKNQALQEIVQEISGNPEYGGMQLYYSPLAYEATITHEALAADCFHPNLANHKNMAAQFWDEQPFFK